MGQIEQSLSAFPPEARGGRMAIPLESRSGLMTAEYSGSAPASGFPAPWPGVSAETGAGQAPSPGTGAEIQPPGDRPANFPGLRICISREIRRGISGILDARAANPLSFPRMESHVPGEIQGDSPVNIPSPISRGNREISRVPEFSGFPHGIPLAAAAASKKRW